MASITHGKISTYANRRRMMVDDIFAEVTAEWSETEWEEWN